MFVREGAFILHLSVDFPPKDFSKVFALEKRDKSSHHLETSCEETPYPLKKRKQEAS